MSSRWPRDGRELRQPRRRRQERHKFAYLIVKNNSFAPFARAVFIVSDISRTFSSFYYVKRPVLQLRGRRDHVMRDVQFCLLISEALVVIPV